LVERFKAAPQLEDCKILQLQEQPVRLGQPVILLKEI
jgi:hypothetical protein